MLNSPSHAVIGVSDLRASIEFLRLFGYEKTGQSALPAAAAAALYGMDHEAGETVLTVPGAELGWLRLVDTVIMARNYGTLDSRAFAIDFFSTDLDHSVAMATEAGHHVSHVASYEFGPITIREVEISGPDGLIVTLLESPVKRPTILDQEPDRLHSELHALVWSVTDMEAKLPFWQQTVGFETVTDATFEGEEMAKVLGLPGKTIKARLAVMCDAESNPARLEMIEFLGEPVAQHPNWPLAAGLHAPAFTVDNLEAAMAALAGAFFSEVVEVDTPLHPLARAVTAEAPGHLRFELWQES